MTTRERSHKKVLIFIVAYNAGAHIRSVLDRLPREVFNNPGFQVLVIDDCSKDETAKTASAHVTDLGYRNVTVLRNAINQGYGGNQKVGYRYAAQNGFGLVILLHGDGQYAPELVLEFVQRWRDGADVILGSRMLDKAQARRGGMPFYKWVGNQVLTRFQNLVVGARLAEFHTGYRAYDVGFLDRVPFELDTNEFHFDTEILLQAFAAGAKVVEFPIPTHYGEEICHVNGMKYAKDVAIACLMYRFQKVGFFCSMQYKGLLHGDSGTRGSTDFHAADWIKGPARVLDVGSGSAFLDLEVERRGCKLVRARPSEIGGEDISSYGTVLALDVLERLDDPELFLVNCRYAMRGTERPKMVLSAGNVAFLGLRILLAMGLFNYGERGILRQNHKRLFTLASFRRILRETGYAPGRVRGIGIPFHRIFAGAFGRLLSSVSDALARFWPSMFAYSFLIEAQPLPHSFMLLSSAERYHEAAAVKEL
jgi:glycosyltransferase involved in cell wall biosynthesis